MKKLILLLTVLTFTILASTNTYAQSKNTCLWIAKNIEKDVSQLDPGEQVNQALYKYCDGLRNAISAGTADSWYTIKKYLDQIQDIVDDAKKGRCSGSDCSKVKSNVKKIKRELD